MAESPSGVDLEGIGKMRSLIEKHGKDFGWVFNRLISLESQRDLVAGQIDKLSSQIKSPGRSVTTRHQTSVTNNEPLAPAHPWKLRSANSRIAFINNIINNQPLRISVGMDIPQCGQVLSINASSKIITTQTCSITP
jgi:hypothetical protein